MNIILNTDTYKLSHFMHLPKGTTQTFLYIESRGGKFDEVMLVLFQKALMDLNAYFPTMDDVEEAREVAAMTGAPFNYDGWKSLVELGYWPLAIRAVPEGVMIPTKNTMIGVTNTVDEFHWVPGHLEPFFLRAVWYPSTVGTYSWHCRKTLEYYMEKTSTSGEPVDFKLHDFGARGATSEESSGIAGAAHLVNFTGTDTLSGILLLRKYYGCDMAGFGIPATEHGSIIPYGRDGEVAAYRNFLNNFPTGVIACVIDSYDPFNAAKNLFGEELRMMVTERDGVLVLRSDSGDPTKVVPKLLDIMGEQFGYRTNEKGYKVLSDKVRLIHSDGVNHESIGGILSAMAMNGWGADNIAFGMGGSLHQGVDRDTQKFAMKTSAVKIDGVWHGVYKDPITASGKKSKAGILDYRNGKTEVVSIESFMDPDAISDTQLVFMDGNILKTYSLEEVRENATK